MEMFGDNLCVFTKRSWPTIKALAAHYTNDELEIRVHWFPLPYHHNSFPTAMANHLVGNSAFGGKPVGAMEFDFAEAVFANQSQILGDSTKAGGIQLLTSLAEGPRLPGPASF
jgi:hypothetical protein